MKFNKSVGVQVDSLDPCSTDGLLSCLGDLNSKIDNFVNIGTESKLNKQIELYSDLNELLGSEKSFTLMLGDCMAQRVCSTCKNYLEINKKISKGGSKSGTLASGYTLDEAHLKMLRTGGNQQWYTFKHTVKAHVHSAGHANAIIHKQKMATNKKQSRSAIFNQFRAAINVLNTKAAATHYESMVITLNKSGAEVGSIGHSRTRFNNLLYSLEKAVDDKCKHVLKKPLKGTQLPPHFYVTADKATPGRETNQVVMACFVNNGRRVAVPLECPKVYQDASGKGGSAEDLAESVHRALIERLDVTGSLLAYAQGKCMDGQYVRGEFNNVLNKKIEAIHKVDTDFWYPIVWDNAHALNIVFNNLRTNERTAKFFKILTKRISVINNTFGHGKMFSLALETAKERDLPFRCTQSISNTRFFSSIYKELEKLTVSLPNYIETFLDHKAGDDEIEYSLSAQDFIIDVLGFLDIFKPFNELMLISQNLQASPWRIVSLVEKLIKHVAILETDLKHNCLDKFKNLSAHLEDIDNKKFKGAVLEEGWNIQQIRK